MAITANDETKKLAKTWLCRATDVVFMDSDGVPASFDIDDLQKSWREKRSHFIFDRTLNIKFAIPKNMLNVWPQVENSFKKLRSSSKMHQVTGRSNKNTASIKQSGGATSSISTSDLSLCRSLPKRIKSDIKPLTFKTDDFSVYVFPTFVAMEFGKEFGIIPLCKLKLTRESTLIVGKAPGDAEVVGRTWKYVNISGRNKGQPDKRRTDNELLDNYKMDAIYLHVGNSAEDYANALEYRFSNSASSLLFYTMFSTYMLALFAELNSAEDQDVEKPQESGDTIVSNGDAYFLVSSGIFSSGEDRINNPTELDINNVVEALNSLGDDGYSWLRLHQGEDAFIQSAPVEGKGFSLEFCDGKGMVLAKNYFGHKEISAMYAAYSRGDIAWKEKIVWGQQG